MDALFPKSLDAIAKKLKENGLSEVFWIGNINL